MASAPPALDSSLVRRLLRTLLLAAWLHFAVSAWMFAALPSYTVNLGRVDSTGVVRTVAVGDASGQFDLRERLRKVTFLVELAAFLATTGAQDVARREGRSVRRLCSPA